LQKEVKRLNKQCAYLERRLSRLLAQQIHQERIDDINRHLLKHTNEKLRQYHAEAERQSSSKSDFLANMSHEIRTPLNIILGMANLLAETPLDTTQTQYLKSLRITGRQLTEIINNVLEFSRIEAGMVVCEPEPFSLVRIFNELELSIAPLCVQKNLKYTVRYPPHLIMERIGDPIKIYQILLNLINNAVKFTAAGGIVLNIQEDARCPGHLLLSVHDTGIGISPEHQRVIFDRFVQVHDVSAKSHSGSGLGLAISRKLTEAMGGSLSVQSIPDEGSTFICSLPLPPVPAAERSQIRLDSTLILPHEFPTMAVLIVDDIRENAEVIKFYLKEYPMSAEVAENGEEALSRVRNGNYDIILMDIRMPVMDGLTATEQIRQLERQGILPRQTILAITAHAFHEQQKRIVQIGFDGILSKPFSKRDLLQAIYRHAVLKKGPPLPQTLGNKALGFCLEADRAADIPEGLLKLLPALIATISEDLGAMHLAMENRKLRELYDKAHSLRGVAGMFGLHKLGSLVENLSQTVKAANFVVAGELFAALDLYLAGVRQSVEERGQSSTSNFQSPQEGGEILNAG
jgi:signal transduction histidine kinase/CheY-like chemotaxis protein/HPt (histidine-containing phosphotransfer) domain-containing protein